MPDQPIAEDKELISLLNKLGKQPTDTIDSEQEPIAQSVRPEVVRDVPIIAEMSKSVVEPELRPPAPPEVPKSDLMNTAPQPKDAAEISQLLTKFATVIDTIIANYGTDRGQIELAIQLIEPMIREAATVNKKVPPAFVDSWTRLLQTKAEINTNATSALDSVAKLLAAAKNNQLVVQTNVGTKGGGMDLVTLLQLPRTEDEDLTR
jgi:hypothetical protein